MKQSLEQYIFEHSLNTPDRVAIIAHGEATTYASLWSMILARAEELRREGVSPGDVYVIRSQQSLSYLVTYFALHYLHAVVCPLEKNVSDQRFNQICSDVAGLKCDPETDSDILYTTGTTGVSKGVLINRRAILCNGENLVFALGFRSDLTFVITGPINHSGNWSKVIPTMMVGATLYVLEDMKDVNLFFDAMSYGSHKTACFLVPASIRMLLLLSRKRLSALSDKIDFIETGGAPISSADMKMLAETLPHTRLFNTYASSECGMICTYNFNDGKYKNSCCGTPMKHASFEIVEGKVVCQNGGQMSGYVNAPQLTASVLREGRVYTNDLARIDDDGMLVIEGRDGDVINVGAMKVSPSEVESVALAFPEVSDCICLPKPHPVMGNVVRLLVVAKAPETFDKRKLVQFIASRLENYKVPQTIELIDAVKRTYNGKLDRKAYL